MNSEKSLKILFKNHYNEDVSRFSLLPASGSNRKYYLMIGNKHQCLGAYNDNFEENLAFLDFSRQFLEENLNVPKIFAEDLENNIYLLEFLGNTSLFSLIDKQNNFSTEIIEIYKRVIDNLIEFQTIKDFDYSKAYPVKSFDDKSMLWDMHYFKYYFLKLAKICFHETRLERDFENIANYLQSLDNKYFLYRDFQSRNIMIYEGKAYFIDYQGGRRGILHYDIASLLYDAKANLPQNVRDELLDYYLEKISEKEKIESNFKENFSLVVLLRIMQAMGSYGYRGYFERKEFFLKSIPYAVENIDNLFKNNILPIEIPELTKVFKQISANPDFRHHSIQNSKLTVEINSFSYRKSLPIDNSGNGGGFIFDCRFLPNPGRFEEYKNLTGQDEAVKVFLRKEKSVNQFLDEAFSIVKSAVTNYIHRDFEHLQVNFGCTGGQHRSVYCAEELALRLKKEFPIKISLTHLENHSQKKSI